jgi:hypothetical protein
VSGLGTGGCHPGGGGDGVGRVYASKCIDRWGDCNGCG